jgi:hypothetical protein
MEGRQPELDQRQVIAPLTPAGVREGSRLASLQRRQRPQVATREASGRQERVKAVPQRNGGMR